MIYTKDGTPLNTFLAELVLVRWERQQQLRRGRPHNFMRDPGDRSVIYKVEKDKTGAPYRVMRAMVRDNTGANSWRMRAFKQQQARVAA